MEKLVILQSGLWDANYYIEKYHPEMKKDEALEYWMDEGYKKAESPSEIFDAKAYNRRNSNPIIDYLTRGAYTLEALYYQNKYPAPQCVVDKYLFDKKNRKSKKVVYTCITNNYDDLSDIKAYYYTDTSWDYICFTDNPDWLNKKQVGIWECRPLVFNESDNSRNNRWHKIFANELFPEYEESVYIDANINILTPNFFEMINSTDKDILLPIHSSRVDLYKELKWAKKKGFDEVEIIDKQYKLIEQNGFPENYGLFENNIIYRKHKNSEIIQMMEEWWIFVKNMCKRDQTSLAYIFWKHNRKIKDYAFENTRIDYKNFCIYKHKKGYELCKY